MRVGVDSCHECGGHRTAQFCQCSPCCGRGSPVLRLHSLPAATWPLSFAADCLCLPPISPPECCDYRCMTSQLAFYTSSGARTWLSRLARLMPLPAELSSWLLFLMFDRDGTSETSYHHRVCAVSCDLRCLPSTAPKPQRKCFARLRSRKSPVHETSWEVILSSSGKHFVVYAPSLTAP